MALRGSLPHRGRKQVDFANEVKRNRYGFPADTKYRGNLNPRREQDSPPPPKKKIILFFFCFVIDKHAFCIIIKTTETRDKS